MDIQELLRDLVIESGIPVKKLAAAVFMNENTFKNKLNPNLDTHHVYIEDIAPIVKELNTDAIAHYFAEQRGLMCIKKMSFDDVSDQAIYDLSLTVREKEGNYAKVIRLAMQDGEIDFQESAEIRQKYHELLASQQEHQNKIDAFMALCEETNAIRAKK